MPYAGEPLILGCVILGCRLPGQRLGQIANCLGVRPLGARTALHCDVGAGTGHLSRSQPALGIPQPPNVATIISADRTKNRGICPQATNPPEMSLYVSQRLAMRRMIVESRRARYEMQTLRPPPQSKSAKPGAFVVPNTALPAMGFRDDGKAHGPEHADSRGSGG